MFRIEDAISDAIGPAPWGPYAVRSLIEDYAYYNKGSNVEDFLKSLQLQKNTQTGIVKLKSSQYNLTWNNKEKKWKGFEKPLKTPQLAELRILIREMLFVQTMVGPSRIEGNGLYAGEFIPAGRPVLKWVEGLDRTFPLDYPNKLPLQAREAFMKFASCDGQTWCLAGDDGIYFNHSESPNVRPTYGKGSVGTWERVAVRDILPGEELTMDYRDIGIDDI